MFLNNRHYDPSTGVFVSVDPLVVKTMQPYVYGAANPVTYSDPTGLCPFSGCWESFDAYLRGFQEAASHIQTSEEESPGSPLPFHRVIAHAEASANASLSFNANHLRGDGYRSRSVDRPVLQPQLETTPCGRFCDYIEAGTAVIGDVVSNPLFQAAVTIAACSTGVGCGFAVAGFTAWNANERAIAAGGWGEAAGSGEFWLATGTDVALAAVQLRSLQAVNGVVPTSIVTTTNVSSVRHAAGTPGGRQILYDNTLIVLGSTGLTQTRDIWLAVR